MEKKGTDKELFGDDTPRTIPTNGRPQLNRDLAKRLFLAGFKPSQVATRLGCHVKTARRLRAELEKAGELGRETREEPLGITQASFDEEAKTATGFSFLEWLKGKTVHYTPIFSFCQRCWESPEIWDRPSLVIAKDPNEKLGDQLCVKFITVFGEDKDRIRRRKKEIRNLFRFLGRHDLCDRHLTMTQSRDPRPIRRIPMIEMFDFPKNLGEAIEDLGNISKEIQLAIKVKVITQMRTGNRSKERGLMGIRIGPGFKSYLIMNSPDSFSFKVFEKMGEEWSISWIPKEIRAELYDLYKTRTPGEPLFKIDVKELRRTLQKTTLDRLGMELNPHDMRKVSVTWLYVMGLPLEIATMLNVGWKDLNTPRDHYLQIRTLLKKDDKRLYRENIPAWFKEGLDQYTEEK